MYLIERLSDGNASFFEFYLHHRQPVDQDGYVVAIGLCTGLFELVDYLHLVSGDMLLIDQIDVLDMPVVEHEVIDIIVMQFARFFHKVVAGSVQILFTEALPLGIGEGYAIEVLQLCTHISQECRRRSELWQVFVALTLQILYQFTLQSRLALIVGIGLRNFLVLV